MLTRDIQQALKDKGFDPGPIDGERGAMTVAAIIAFQRVNGLQADGVVGPKTAAKLFGDGVPAERTMRPLQGTPWMIEAQSLLGVTEDTSDDDNPLIMGWAETLDIDFEGDEVPWCGLFIAHCFGSQLPTEPRPSGPLGARNWRRFGKETEPQFGALLVFWRGSPDGTLGHVGFYVGENRTHFHVLGGNQADKVSVILMPKRQLIGVRWPSLLEDPRAGPIHRDGQGRITEDLG